MPTLDHEISDVIHGDDLQLKRNVSNIPPGATIVAAAFSLKARSEDDDSAAVIRKDVTTVDQPGIGQVVNTGAGTCTVRFDLTSADWANAERDKEYLYDMRVKTNTGAFYTFENGHLTPKAEISRTL